MNITIKFLRPAPNLHANAITVDVAPRVYWNPDGQVAVILARFDAREHALTMTQQEARVLGLELLRFAGTT